MKNFPSCVGIIGAIAIILIIFPIIVNAGCLDLNDGKHEKVTISSSTAGTQIVAKVGGGCSIVVEPGSSTGSAWISRTGATCSSAVTSYSGVPISIASGTPYSPGYEYDSKVDGYNGQLCGILESGSTSINLCVNCW